MIFQENTLKLTERLGTVRKLNIIDGVTVYNTNPKDGRSYDPLPSEPEERSRQLTARLWESASDLLQKSELEFTFNGGDDKDESRSLDDGEFF